MAREKKQAPLPAPSGRSRPARAAGSGAREAAGTARSRGRQGEEPLREAARQARPSRSSAASGRVSGAMRSDASVRGRHGEDEPLEAGPTASARGGAPARLEDGEREVSEEPVHTASPTAVAAEALRTGVVEGAVPASPADEEIPGESEKIRVGDPDDEALRNEYVGEETPGGSTPTPDQSNVDDIGRAYGVQEEDSGELRTTTEILESRDQRRRGQGGGRRRS